jgi:hypothetical protein
MPDLNRSVISNIENGRRRYVAVEEAFVLARALEVAPVDLMIPGPADREVTVTPVETATARAAREWMRGETPLPDTDMDIFLGQPRALDELRQRADAGTARMEDWLERVDTAILQERTIGAAAGSSAEDIDAEVEALRSMRQEKLTRFHRQVDDVNAWLDAVAPSMEHLPYPGPPVESTRSEGD